MPDPVSIEVETRRGPFVVDVGLRLFASEAQVRVFRVEDGWETAIIGPKAPQMNAAGALVISTLLSAAAIISVEIQSSLEGREAATDYYVAGQRGSWYVCRGEQGRPYWGPVKRRALAEAHLAELQDEAALLSHDAIPVQLHESVVEQARATE